jgi:GNAT superfamily N-acetyltransferase
VTEIDCVRDRTAEEFAEQAWEFVARDPVRNNVLCTLVEDAHHGDGTPREWLRVLDGDRILGVAVRTPGRGVLVSDLSEPGSHALARHLAGTVPPLLAITGPAGATATLAHHYARLSGFAMRPGRAQRLFRLDRVIPPAPVPGGPRPATAADRDLILGWMVDFSRDTLGRPALRDDHTARVDMLLGYPDLMWFWEVEGVPVSFAWRSPVRPPPAWPRTPVTRVSAVFTPVEHRGRGYASANVAALSQRALNGGATACMLYTDLANPVSNKIYQRIGYQPVDDAREWVLS